MVVRPSAFLFRSDTGSDKGVGVVGYKGIEGTSLGNLAVQMIADGAFPDLQSVRDAIATSFDVKRFE